MINRDDNHGLIDALQRKKALVPIKNGVSQRRHDQRPADNEHHKRGQHDYCTHAETIKGAGEDAAFIQSSISMPS